MCVCACVHRSIFTSRKRLRNYLKSLESMITRNWNENVLVSLKTFFSAFSTNNCKVIQLFCGRNAIFFPLISYFLSQVNLNHQIVCLYNANVWIYFVRLLLSDQASSEHNRKCYAIEKIKSIEVFCFRSTFEWYLRVVLSETF